MTVLTNKPIGTDHRISTDETGNSTKLTLGAGAVFVGVWEDVTSFTTAGVAMGGSMSTDGTLYIETSSGGSTVETSVPYNVLNVTLDIPRVWNIVERYFRIRYVNGTTPQTGSFSITTKFANGQPMPILNVIGDPLNDNVNAQVVKAVITGQDHTGTFRNVPLDVHGNTKVHLAAPVTAFGEMRTAEVTAQVQLSFNYNINTDMVTPTEINGGTVTQADAMAILQTGTNVAGESRFDSRKVIKYRNGQGTLIRFTACYTAGVADSQQIIGAGDDEDAIAIGFNGTEFGILIRQDGSDLWIPQNTWNQDKVDGSGNPDNPSQMLFDPTKLNVFEINYQWLGAGAQFFSVEDPLTGKYTPIHTRQYANTSTIPYMYNPTFPLLAQVKNTGNNTNLILKTASMGGFIEGKNIVTGPINAFAGSKSIGTSQLAIFSIKNRATHASKTNRVTVLLNSFSASNDVNKLSTFSILENATLGGIPAFTDLNTTNSVIQTDVAATTVTGGKLIYAATVAKDSGEAFPITELNLELRPGITWTIAGVSTGGPEILGVAVTWSEDF